METKMGHLTKEGSALELSSKYWGWNQRLYTAHPNIRGQRECGSYQELHMFTKHDLCLELELKMLFLGGSE